MALSLEPRKRSVLECPICYDWLQPPVSTCENGHGVCQQCRNAIYTCGVCRGIFKNKKNTLLDDMLESMLMKCSNEGCEKSFPVSNVLDHEKQCFFRKIPCFLCDEEMIHQKLNDHFTVQHADKSHATVNLGSPVSMRVSIYHWLLEGDCLRYFILYAMDININFLVRLAFRENKEILYVCVQFLGRNQEEAKNYIYDLKINQKLPFPNQESYFICSGVCTPYGTFNLDLVKKNGKSVPLKLESIFFSTSAYLADFRFEIKIRKLL